MEQIEYRTGYKHQLATMYVVETGIKVEDEIRTHFIYLTKEGLLTIYLDYAWDGPTGIWFFTRKLMRASLVHDALYQLLREGFLEPDRRASIDALYRKLLLEDKTWPFRAWYHRRGIRYFAAGAADPKARKKILTAP